MSRYIVYELTELSDEELSGLTTEELILLTSEHHLIDTGQVASGELHVVVSMHELSFEEEEGRDLILRLLRGVRSILALEA